MTTPRIDREPRTDMLRAGAKGIAGGKDAIVRDGGDRGAGLIRGAAVITRGEALGHGMWIDSRMLEQTRDAINAAGKQGVKARFTHPGLSSDGLGSFLGRFKGPATIDGDVVRADLHFSPSAHHTPDGDLAEYTMDLAADDPQSFGNSIVFMRDRDAMLAFENENTQPVEETDGRGRKVTRHRFRSPDPLNVDHLPHARLKTLRAIDAVDSPAANPGGMFHSNPIPAEADALLDYVLGATDERPELASLSVDPDRAANYLRRYLDRRNLTIAPKQGDSAMSKDATKPSDTKPTNDTPLDDAGTKPTDSPAVDPQAEFAARHKQFVDAFGATNGNQWLAEGKSFAEAEQLHAVEQEKARAAELAAKDEQIARLTSERDELAKRIDSAKLGEETPPEFSGEKPPKDKLKATGSLSDGAAAYAASIKIPGR